LRGVRMNISVLLLEQCRCPWRNEGRRCEREKTIRVPQFHGQSYLSYAVPADVLHDQQLQFRLQFSTRIVSGLIAYVHNGDASVYMAVFVELGALKFRLSCGTHQMTLVETKRNVSDGSLHTVNVR